MLTATAQAQHVSYRSTAHYNKRVAQFEREGGINENSIVMLGNSLTENGKNWGERLGMDNVVNRGIIGDNTIGMTERLCQITPHKPKVIFLMALSDSRPPTRNSLWRVCCPSMRNRGVGAHWQAAPMTSP